MSLHTLAKHVQQKGRGKDQVLVHMSPREVQGLQALAKASGGSLTINPETGLAEAGFLEQVLPIVAMAAATYFTAGAAAPALSAALGSTMAGGVAAGTLAGAGVGAIGAAAQDKDVGQGALYGGIGGAISGGMGAYGDANVLGAGATPTPSPDVVNKVALDTAAGSQIPGASGLPVGGDGISGGASMTPPPPPGTPPPTPPTGRPAFTADEMAMGSGRPELSGRVNTFDPYAKIPGEPSINPAPSYYSTMGTPGKLMTQALPGMTADMGMNVPKPYRPEEEDYSGAFRISPDFKGYTPERPDPYKPQYTRYAAGGGLMSLAEGGPLEQISKNAIGGQSNMFPQSQQPVTAFATPTQMPASAEIIRSDFDTKTNPYTGNITMSDGGDPAKKKKKRASLTADRTMAAMRADQAGIAALNNARYGANMTGVSPLSSMSLGDLPNSVGAAGGGLADLGGYSDGGRLLKGPGDGMSDNIPAQIGRKQPARLADGEFVVPADVVSHLGNGSTDAGAKRLYAMMAKVRQSRTGKKKQAPAVNMNKFLPV